MKKWFLLLALALTPLMMFWSCNDDTLDEFTGYVKFSLNGQSYDYSGAVGKKTGEKFIITTGSSQGLVTISLEGCEKGTYKLGLGTSLDAVASFISNGLNYENLSNTVIFYPFEGEKYVILGGSCTITESEGQIKGEFSGVACPWNNVTNLNATSLLTLIKGSNNISGSFAAYKL